MADGRKIFETRSWQAPAWLVGQPYAIHAAKKIDVESSCEFGYTASWIPRGCIVSIHLLVDCRRFTKFNIVDIQDEYGDFEPGRFGWHSPLLYKLPEPIPVIGHQGLFDWPYDWKDGQLVMEESNATYRTLPWP